MTDESKFLNILNSDLKLLKQIEIDKYLYSCVTCEGDIAAVAKENKIFWVNLKSNTITRNNSSFVTKALP